MNQRTLSMSARIGLGAMAVALAGTAAAMGCTAIANIGDIEFGPTSAGASSPGGSGTGAGATGGTGVGAHGGQGAAGGQGGSGATAGAGGTPPAPTCFDGKQNGSELGIDCGGPDCAPCQEDCTDGVDNDGDGNTDCADSKCSGYTCATPPPQGWTGPVAFYVGSPNGVTPACDAAWPTAIAGHSILSAPAATCGCTCGAAQGSSCGQPTLTVSSGSNCLTNNGSYTPGEGQCLSMGPTAPYAMTTPVPVTQGTCTATPSKTITPASWGEEDLVCDGATLGKGCPDPDAVCVRKPQGPFSAGLCIAHDGDVSCPLNGPYATKHLIYDDVTDDRSCSNCSCDPASGATCAGNFTLYGNSGCSTQHDTLPAGAPCTPVSNAHSLSFKHTSGPTVGSCSPPAGAGQPTGTATPVGPRTVCCTP